MYFYLHISKINSTFAAIFVLCRIRNVNYFVPSATQKKYSYFVVCNTHELCKDYLIFKTAC